MTTGTVHILIAEKRKKLNKTLQEVADKVGISAAFLSDIEHGRRNPSEWTIDKLCKELELDSDYVFFLMHKIPPDINVDILSPNYTRKMFVAIRTKIEEVNRKHDRED